MRPIPELVWKGKLPGLLLPGVQMLWHVATEVPSDPNVPIETLILPPQHESRPHVGLNLAEEPAILIERIFDPKLYGHSSGEPSTVSFQAVCVGDGGDQVFFIDDDQMLAIVLRFSIPDSKVFEFSSELTINDYFLWELAPTPVGGLAATSGIATALVDREGHVTARRRLSSDVEGWSISAGQDVLLIRTWNGRLQLLDYELQPVREFDQRPSSGGNRVWVDASGRYWADGPSILLLSPNGEPIQHWQRSEFVGSDGMDLMGVGENDLVWFGSPPHFCAFQAV